MSASASSSSSSSSASVPGTTRAVRRAAGKRVFLGAIDENATSASSSMVGQGENPKPCGGTEVSMKNIDWADASGESLELFFQDLERAMQQRIVDGMDHTESQCMTQLDTIESSYLMKLTKSTRQMTVAQFHQKHGSSAGSKDLHTVCTEILEQNGGFDPVAYAQAANNSNHSNSNNSNTTCNANSNNATDEYGRPLRTPARVAGGKSLLGAMTPATVRAPKRGEVFYSAKGSPIGAAGASAVAEDPTTETGDSYNGSNDNHNDSNNGNHGDVMMSMKKPANGKGSKMPCISVNVVSGKGSDNVSMDVTDPNFSVENLDSPTRQQAYLQLQTFQDQLSSVMGQFQKKMINS